MFVPLRQLIWLFFLSVSHLNIPAQTVNLSSFQHTQRWVSEYNFPVYTNEKNVQDSIFAFTSSSLKNKLNAKQVNLPEKIEYDYIGGFGKAKMKNIKLMDPQMISNYLFFLSLQELQLGLLSNGIWKHVFCKMGKQFSQIKQSMNLNITMCTDTCGRLPG